MAVGLCRTRRLLDLAHLRDTQTILRDTEAKVSALVVDYVRQTGMTNKVHYHVPVMIGARDDGMRGLYLAPQEQEIRENTPIFTVPYSGFITNQSIMTMTGAPPDLTLQEVERVWPDDELKPLVPAVHLAAHIGIQMDRLPRHSRGIAEAAEKAMQNGQTDLTSDAIREYKRVLALHTLELMPWCRMIDDEDWNDEHIFNMYRGSLDQFQQKNYDELSRRFSKAITTVHIELALGVRHEHLRRLSRVLIGRFESVPTASTLTAHPLVRRLSRAYRNLRRKPHPRVNTVVPTLEMINHSGRPNVGVRFGVFDGVPGVRVYSLSRIVGGKELCRSYNFALDKSNALFRYGFLPFEIVTVPEMNQWKEHYVDNIYPNVGEQPEAQRAAEAKLQTEVSRLQKIFEKKDSRR